MYWFNNNFSNLTRAILFPGSFTPSGDAPHVPPPHAPAAAQPPALNPGGPRGAAPGRRPEPEDEEARERRLGAARRNSRAEDEDELERLSSGRRHRDGDEENSSRRRSTASHRPAAHPAASGSGTTSVPDTGSTAPRPTVELPHPPLSSLPGGSDLGSRLRDLLTRPHSEGTP